MNKNKKESDFDGEEEITLDNGIISGRLYNDTPKDIPPVKIDNFIDKNDIIISEDNNGDDDDIPSEEGDWLDAKEFFSNNLHNSPVKRSSIPVKLNSPTVANTATTSSTVSTGNTYDNVIEDEVEAFELDPNFDYDHVKCTPRFKTDKDGNIILS